MKRVRVVAQLVVWRGEQILVYEGFDTMRGKPFYRPLGGTVEFGEYAADAVVRELREELGAEVIDVRPLGTLENIFVYQDEPGHEVVLMFEGRLADPSFYARDEMQGQEDDTYVMKVLWKSLDDFKRGDLLYPSDLLALLTDPTDDR